MISCLFTIAPNRRKCCNLFLAVSDSLKKAAISFVGVGECKISESALWYDVCWCNYLVGLFFIVMDLCSLQNWSFICMVEIGL